MQNAGSTAAVLNEIIAGINKSNDLVNEISASSREQAESVKEINDGLTNVNNVVQQNSSISEQSASASEELTTQATQLKELMKTFRLAQGEEHLVMEDSRPLLTG